MHPKPENFMQEACNAAKEGVDKNAGGPFGCVIVHKGEIIARGYNKVTSTNDPTAHAEVVAIRKACQKLNSFQLTDCDLYTSCEPCPMCMGAIYWARPKNVFYANTREDAAKIGFDDQFIYDEIAKPIADRKRKMTQLKTNNASEAFQLWKNKTNKHEY